MTKSNGTVSTSQVVSSVANRFSQLPKKITRQLLADFLAAIENELVAGHKVRIEKLGIIQTKERAARKGRNPKTGEEIQIPASKKVAFRVAKSLKERVGTAATKTTRRSK